MSNDYSSKAVKEDEKNNSKCKKYFKTKKA